MDAKAASNWYRWLWFSPLLTIPTLVLVYLINYEEIPAVLVSAGWHLILLIPATNRKDQFISWHGRQALALAGLRTLFVLFFYEELMDDPIVVIFLLVLIWFFGTRWGQKEAKAGKCSFMRWFGEQPNGEKVPAQTFAEETQKNADILRLRQLEFLIDETKNWDVPDSVLAPYAEELQKLRTRLEPQEQAQIRRDPQEVALELDSKQAAYDLIQKLRWSSSTSRQLAAHLKRCADYLAPQLEALSKEIVGQQVHRPRADSPDQNGVVAAAFDGRGKVAAAVGVAPAAGQRRLAGHHPAAGKQAAGTGQQTRGESQNVFGPQGVGSRGNPAVEQVGRQAGPRQAGFVHGVGDLLAADVAAAKIDPQAAAHVSFAHGEAYLHDRAAGRPPPARGCGKMLLEPGRRLAYGEQKRKTQIPGEPIMRSLKWIRRAWGALLLAAAFGTAAAAETGAVWGTVGLEMPNGNYVAGENIRLMLVRTAIEIEMPPPLADQPKVRRAELLADCHMRFFVQVRRHLGRDGYLIDDTMSTPRGTFEFVGVPPGRYWVVVTFPALINGFKAAWQTPVDVPAGGRIHLPLDHRNLFLPSGMNLD